MLAAGVAPAIVKAASLMPVKVMGSGVVVPEWGPMVYPVGNQLLTIDMITSEALRVLHKNMIFVQTINRSYDEAFIAVPDQR